MIRELWNRLSQFAGTVKDKASAATSRYEEKQGLEKGYIVHRAQELALLAPRLAGLIVALLRDPRVPLKSKLVAGATLAYVVSPIDLIPEIILGPLGMVDDAVAIIFALHILINGADRAVVLDHWKGDEDVLELVKDSLELVERFVTRGALDKITKWTKG